MPRSFLAVVPGKPLITKLEALIQELRLAAEDSHLKVRWVAPSLLHVTLRFLGDVSEAQLAAVSRELSDVALLYAPFAVKISGVSFLPNPHRPRVVFAAMEDSPLSSIAQEIEARLLALKFPAADHPFRAHLTLGRIREVRRVSEFVTQATSLGQRFAAPPFAVEELVLFRSDLRPSGPVYTPIARAPLRGDS